VTVTVPAGQAQGSPEDDGQLFMPRQELRLAITMSGGVSLAVWMGGVARELNLLAEASSQPAAVPGEVSGDAAVREFYRSLLELMCVSVRIDVLSGTSAGGINAALLGLAAIGRCDLARLREFWIDWGALDKLMRDPRVADPPSLLQGDSQLLADLRSGIGEILRPAPSHAPPTDVFVTTTLLSGETSCYTDDYGTVISTSDHHGVMHFTQDDLCGDIVGPLSLAARSTASFPGAFEPSFLPSGKAADSSHPDMASYSNLTVPHWAADGGLLDNNPIGPLLETVFDRSADREVRRVLLYVVPTSAPAPAPPPEVFASPPGLAQALISDLGAALSQSIATELQAIRDHNDRVAARVSSRLRLAELSSALLRIGQQPLADTDAWVAYRRRQAERLAQPLVAEALRQVATIADKPPAWKLFGPGTDAEEQLCLAAAAAITKDWPASLPAPGAPADTLADAVSRLGRPAWDAGMTTVLDMLHAGFVLAVDPADHQELAQLIGQVHALLPDPPGSLRKLVTAGLQSKENRSQPLSQVICELAEDYYSRVQADPETLKQAWLGLQEPVNAASRLTGKLAANFLSQTAVAAPDQPAESGDGQPAGVRAGDQQAAARPSPSERKARAARKVRTYLAYLGAGQDQQASADTGPGQDPAVAAAIAGLSQATLIRRLVELHVLEQSIVAIAAGPDQPVELIEISADTRTSLDPARHTAQAKLTGMQVHHFGAFYKDSWRANDWMWGRLDGAGWVAHLLLDPRRILAVLQAEDIPADQRASIFLDRLQKAIDPGGVLDPAERARLLADLDYLGKEDTQAMPPSLPELALWVAAVAQRRIAADELAEVARQVSAGQDEKPSAPENSWLAAYERATKTADPDEQVRAVAALLPSCPVAGETISAEARDVTPLFLRTASQALAVGVGVAASIKKPAPVALRGALQTARTISLTAYMAIDRTNGVRRNVILAGVALMVAGVLAMLTHTVWLGLPGLVLFGAGTLMTLIATWQAIPQVLAGVTAVVIALIAAAPWLPWLDTRLFSWINHTFVPFLQQNKWAWTVFFLFVLIPPVTAVAGLWRRRQRAPRGPAPQQAAGAPTPGR
jgi:patatin-related protein